MSRNQKKVSAIDSMLLMIVMLNVVAIKIAYLYSRNYYWVLLLLLPVLLLIVYNNRKRKKSSQHNSSNS